MKYKNVQEETSDKFGYMATTFSELFAHQKKPNCFLDSLKSISNNPKFYKDKIILDVGCGIGRITYSASLSTKHVIGLDISNSVKVAKNNTSDRNNVSIVKGSLLNLPFKNIFNVMYSFGVIHHLPDPFKGFKKLVNFMKTGSLLLVSVYGSKMTGNLWYVKLIRKITLHLPKVINYYLAYLLSIFIHYGLNNLQRFLFRCGSHKIATKVPYNHTSNYPFKYKQSIAFDALSTPIAIHYEREELKNWIENVPLEEVKLLGSEKKGWVIIGRKK